MVRLGLDGRSDVKIIVKIVKGMLMLVLRVSLDRYWHIRGNR